MYKSTLYRVELVELPCTERHHTLTSERETENQTAMDSTANQQHK